MTNTIEFETTTYRNNRGEFAGIVVTWGEVENLLGREHHGDAEDDSALVGALLAAGAPAWVADAEGWVDEYGWGLIGPEMPAEDEGDRPWLRPIA